MKRFGFLFVLPIALAACVVGPSYQVPEKALVNQPVAKQRLEELPGETSTAQPLTDDWWKLYDAPVLDELVHSALEKNTDVRVAAANLERARADVRFAAEQGGFSGGVSGAQSRGQVAAEQYLQSAKAPVSYASDIGITLNYEIDLFGTLKRGVEAASADSDAALAARDVARVAVVSDVVAAYVQICGTGEEADAAHALLSRQRVRRELVARLHVLGRADASETTREDTELQQIQATLPQYEARRRIAQYRLAALLAQDPSELPQAVKTCNRLPQLQSAQIPVGDGAALLKRRPDVREAERRLAAATARVGVSIGALYPRVILGASAGLTGATGDLGLGNTQRWNFGPMMSWTFPVNGARSRVSAAQSEAAAALASFDGSVLQALKEVQSSLAGYAGALQNSRALKGAYDSATESANDVHRRFVGGRATYLEDLDANRTLNQDQLKLAESRFDVAARQIELFKSLGGGWQSDAATADSDK